jgi:hypothetical protein
MSAAKRNLPPGFNAKKSPKHFERMEISFHAGTPEAVGVVEVRKRVFDPTRVSFAEIASLHGSPNCLLEPR